MFAYCTEVSTSRRPRPTSASPRPAPRESIPVLLTMLADGRLHLTAIAKLAPHLTPENRDGLLERAVHRTKRQIEELVAEIAPRPDVPALMRRLPERRPRRPAALSATRTRADLDRRPARTRPAGCTETRAPSTLPVSPSRAAVAATASRPS